MELQPLQEPVLRHEMRGMGYSPEDLLLCVDADAEVNVEMKAGGGVKGLSRLDAVKQALVLFVHSKLLMQPATPILSRHFEQQCSVCTFTHILSNLLQIT